MPISTGSRRGARRATLLVAVGLAVLLAPPLRAQEAPDPTEACDDHVLASGLCLGAEALADGFVNLDGGLRRGAAALGQVKLTLLADLDRMAGLRGWSIGLGAYALVGRRPTETLTGGLAPASGAEALPTAALADAWVQYAVPGRASLRVGQMAADNEFARADAAEYLVNSTFSWPVALTEALPSGGPAYPFAAPGLRLSLADPDQGSGLRLALFSGDPGGRYGEETEPQRHNRYGINPSFTGGALMLAEAVVGADRPGEAPRPWVLRLGGWYHNGGFDDVRRDSAGRSLADPRAGAPRRYGQNYGGYAIGEVALGPVALFARGFYAPPGRNTVTAQGDLGLAWRDLPWRPQDTLSLGVSQAHIGREARRLDRETAFVTRSAWPERSHETVVEVNYNLPLGAVEIRPLVQWMLNPAAGAAEERRGNRALSDSLLVGLRLQITL